MKKIKIIKSTICNKKLAPVKKVLTVEDAEARLLVTYGKAEYVKDKEAAKK